MVAKAAFVVRAHADGAGRLIFADEPLASFHRRCGGELPGPIVTPALIELVARSRQHGQSIACEIRAQDDREAVTMWVEVQPDDVQNGGGTRIAICNWQAQPLADDAAARTDEHRVALAQHMAGLSARLGPRQELLAVMSHDRDLAALAGQMREGLGRPWTDFVTLEGNQHRQPMHWRLNDGARLRLDGSARGWTACIVPLGRSEPGSEGFELHFVPDQPLPEPAPAAAPAVRGSGIGLDIAPVLRQPVSRIIANAETIRTRLAGPLADEYSAYAADIAAAGEHLLALIDDLATLELVEAEDFDPAPDQIDLADLARRAAGILGMRARERGITIRAPQEGESAPAIGEFRRVLQVLLNLVGNAVRYSPEGSEVWLRVESDDGRARVTVADMGEGLDEAQQARVFDKFERLGRQNDGGSGLGLYISRRLATAMKGTLSVESAKGQGARFTLELPGDPDA
jgi:Histidine kinase-, DNA gyrase B-, and HSP90-like ATPase